MPNQRSFLAVVPAYNEETTIASVVASLRRHAPEFDIVVIDDGSTDDTRKVAVRAGVRVVRLPFNCGIGGAVQAGFVYARENGYDYMVQVDGDGQHDPREIRKLIDALAQEPCTDMACGSRFLSSDFHYPAPISR